MTNTAKAARVLIYCRISDDREGEGLGVARQREDCERRVQQTDGWTLVHVYVENDTGASRHSKKSRPKYRDMLDAVRRGEADVILAYSNSRLTRRPMELEDLITLHEQTGVQLRTMVSGDDDLSTADGRMVARIKASVDAAEAERTSERVRRQVTAKVERGEWLGGPRPFGWGETVEHTEDGKVRREHRNVNTINKREAAMVLAGTEHVIDGGSVGELIRTWNASGVRTARGAKWTHLSVNRVLCRWRNCGVYEYRGEALEGTEASWEPLPGITADMVKAVRAILLDPARERASGYAPVHPLSGLALCGKCGSKLLSGGIKTRKGTMIPMYRCSGAGCGLGMKILDLDAHVGEAVAAYFLLQGRARPDKVTKAQSAELRSVRKQRAALKVERADHVALLNDQVLTPAELRPIMAKLDAEDTRLAEAEAAILRAQSHEQMAYRAADVLRPSKATGRISLDHAAQVLGELVEQWRELPLERKRETLRLLFTVTVRPVADVGSKAPDARVVVSGPDGWTYAREVVGAA